MKGLFFILVIVSIILSHNPMLSTAAPTRSHTSAAPTVSPAETDTPNETREEYISSFNYLEKRPHAHGQDPHAIHPHDPRNPYPFKPTASLKPPAEPAPSAPSKHSSVK